MLFNIHYKPAIVKKIFCESDDEGLPLIYAWFAISDNLELIIENVSGKNETLAGCFSAVGIKTIFSEQSLQLSKTQVNYPDTLMIGCEAAPYFAISVAIVCAAKGIQADIKGLQFLTTVNGVDLISLLQRELYRFNINTDFCDYSKLKIYNNKAIIPKTKPVNVEASDLLSLFFILLAVTFGKLKIELRVDFFETQPEIISLLFALNLTVEKL